MSKCKVYAKDPTVAREFLKNNQEFYQYKFGSLPDVCPITLQIMRDPVDAVTEDSNTVHTYERDAIKQLSESGESCPLSLRPIISLVPNGALKEKIDSSRALQKYDDNPQGGSGCGIKILGVPVGDQRFIETQLTKKVQATQESLS